MWIYIKFASFSILHVMQIVAKKYILEFAKWNGENKILAVFLMSLNTFISSSISAIKLEIAQWFLGERAVLFSSICKYLSLWLLHEKYALHTKDTFDVGKIIMFWKKMIDWKIGWKTFNVSSHYQKGKN